MYLCLNILNNKIEGGLFDQSKLMFTFDFGLFPNISAEQLILWIDNICHRYQVKSSDIRQIGFASVLPQMDDVLIKMSQRYFDQTPFILKPGVKTGFKINYKNPLEIGADRIARAVAAKHQFAHKDIVIISLSYINTVCALSCDSVLLGGAIFPGFGMQLESLHQGAERIHAISLQPPKQVIAKSTKEAIQSGLYHSQLGAIEKFIQLIQEQYFTKQKPLILGTGEYVQYFREYNIFSIVVPDLTLEGIKLLMEREHL